MTTLNPNLKLLQEWSRTGTFPQLLDKKCRLMVPSAHFYALGSTGSSLWLPVMSVTSCCTSVRWSIQSSNFKMLFPSVTSVIPLWTSNWSLSDENLSSRWLSDIRTSKRLQEVQILTALWVFQGHALEQRHHPEGVRRLHQEAAAGAAEGEGAGEPPEEAGARQSTSDVEDTGKRWLMVSYD